MSRQAITNLISIDFPSDSPEWRRIRTSEGMVAYLEKMGAETVARCDTDLHAAQEARKQPVADGYAHVVTTGGTRARLYIEPTTARAIAHEAVNHTILKSLPIGGPAEAPADHEVPRELQRGGFKDLLDKRKAESEAKAAKKAEGLAKRRAKAAERAAQRARQSLDIKNLDD